MDIKRQIFLETLNKLNIKCEKVPKIVENFVNDTDLNRLKNFNSYILKDNINSMDKIVELINLFKKDNFKIFDNFNENVILTSLIDKIQDNQINCFDKTINQVDSRDIVNYSMNLWKYNKISEIEPEPFQEYRHKQIKYKNYSLFGSSVRGKKHKHEGSNCDDWFEIDNIDDWFFIAVSDGAGSKKYSRIGAKESCISAIKYIKNKFAEIKDNEINIIKNLSESLDSQEFINSCSKLADIVQNSVIEAYNSVKKAYEARKDKEEYKKLLNRELLLSDFSCTFIISAAIPIYENDEYLIISCQIGDGMTASINLESDYNNSLKLLGIPDSGKFAGETNFLTSSDIIKKDSLINRTKITRGKIDYLLVMTDGVSDDYYPNFPQILRLFIDLQLNGIIQMNNKDNIIVTNKNIELIKKIPEPLLYPWINDTNVNISIQYANRILKYTGLSLKELWNNNEVLKTAYLNTWAYNFSDKNNKSYMLEVWLDNYAERGSFDDRTLVILNLCKEMNNN